MFALLCAVAVLASSCGGNEPGGKTDPKAAPAKLQNALYQGKLQSGEALVYFVFTTGDVDLSGEAPTGNGLYFQVGIIASSVNNALFPAAGEYTIGDEATAGTAYAQACQYVNFEDGASAGQGTFASGKFTIAGDEKNATFTIDFITDEGDTAYYTCKASNVRMNEGNYSPYELNQATTIALNASSASIETVNGGFYLDVVNGDGTGYTLSAVGYNNSSETPYFGTFNVGVNYEDETPGTLWSSAGVVTTQQGASIYPTYYAVVSADGISAQDPIYFVTGGSLTISATGVSGRLTTFYGSTINVSYTGDVTVAPAQQGAPRRPAMISLKPARLSFGK